mmetsp:Transcript_23431/g.48649  ORF Transcript_23431/g.48649 Transcript_23431/m.48649 type:complete len:262 (+) Transcript_23431:180-965(+)
MSLPNVDKEELLLSRIESLRDEDKDDGVPVDFPIEDVAAADPLPPLAVVILFFSPSPLPLPLPDTEFEPDPLALLLPLPLPVPSFLELNAEIVSEVVVSDFSLSELVSVDPVEDSYPLTLILLLLLVTLLPLFKLPAPLLSPFLDFSPRVNLTLLIPIPPLPLAPPPLLLMLEVLSLLLLSAPTPTILTLTPPSASPPPATPSLPLPPSPLPLVSGKGSSVESNNNPLLPLSGGSSDPASELELTGESSSSSSSIPSPECL